MHARGTRRARLLGCRDAADGAGAEEVAGSDEVVGVPLCSLVCGSRFFFLLSIFLFLFGLRRGRYHVFRFLRAQGHRARAIELDLILDQAHIA